MSQCKLISAWLIVRVTYAETKIIPIAVPWICRKYYAQKSMYYFLV